MIGTLGEQKIYYITPKGTRIGSRKSLDQYIKDLEHVGQENFSFLTITLPIGVSARLGVNPEVWS